MLLSDVGEGVRGMEHDGSSTGVRCSSSRGAAGVGIWRGEASDTDKQGKLGLAEAEKNGKLTWMWETQRRWSRALLSGAHCGI